MRNKALSRAILVGALSLFVLIGVVAIFKKSDLKNVEKLATTRIVEVQEAEVATIKVDEWLTPIMEEERQEVDRIKMLFSTGHRKLPIVETVSYRSRVPWLKGRPAWVSDYASYFATSRHFIARSLNGKEDYLTQQVSTGDKFNVFRRDKEIKFHLVIDLSRCKMWFYSYDMGTDERTLLKTYKVGVGRFDKHSSSGLLTPRGLFQLGGKVAIYKPKVMGYFQGNEVELIRVFGTRWIPFANDDINGIRGYGIHGAPWLEGKDGEYVENRECIGKYDSDGCIRLYQKDIEEVFSIVITKPTTIEIVSDIHNADLPGVESMEYPDAI